VLRVALLLFGSGACALVYQVAWLRELRLIFGASTAASAAVLAVFMGGLGIGGARLGRRADTATNPLALYARLEIGVACAAAATPLLVRGANAVYLATGGIATLGAAGATLVRIALSIVVLGPATFLMGGTMPAAARAIGRDDDHERRGIAALYGVNTLGAVVGALLSSFLLLEVLGTQLTLWCAALVNLLVGVLARIMSRSSRGASKDGATAPSDATPAVSESIPWFPPAAAFLAGIAFLLMELTWYRMLAPLLGGSSYTFGLILAVALAGIGIGGGIYARTRAPATLRGFAMTCSLEALLVVLPYALGDRLAFAVLLLRPFSRAGFLSSVLVWTGVASVVVLPAAIVAGAQFPLILGLYGRGAKGVGRDLGAAYFANTAGAIAGSLAGGFGIIPLLGAVGCWRLVVFALALGALVALGLGSRGRRPRELLTQIAPAAIALLLAFARGPTAAWRHSGIGAGRADAAKEASFESFVNRHRRSIRWEVDGVESSVALGQRLGYAFIVNGKSDGHCVNDGATQVMGGLLPAMHHGAPRSALVVGLGTGSTAGWLGEVRSIDHVDVVEIEPAILRVAQDCAPVNHDVLRNPKVHVRLADAREVLRASRERYDVIFSEPSNPYRAGVSSLYTADYYKYAAARLSPHGVFAQWVQAYEIDTWTFATVMRTLREAFADVSIWSASSGDFILLARQDGGALDTSLLGTRLADEPYASASALVWNTTSPEGLLAHFVGDNHLTDAVLASGLGAVNTDDQNLLEFAFARSMGSTQRVDLELPALSRRLGFDRPAVTRAISWDRVVEERWSFQAQTSAPFDPPIAARRDLPFGRVVEAYEGQRWSEVLSTWAALGRAFPSYAEAVMLADAAAHAGAPDEEARVSALPSATEREVLHAASALRGHNNAAAVEALELAFGAARREPWPRSEVLRRGLEMATGIAEHDGRFARRLYDALREPFVVERLREARAIAALRAALATGDSALCVEALEPLEPPPIDEKILSARAACYAKTGHRP
jgi:spermidine synthase